ncbi:MAG: DUF1295 domain-containing protein [Acidobacteriota bacterium]
MNPLLAAWLTGLLAVATLMLFTWMLSLVKRDTSIIDIVWGPAFALAAWVYHLFAPDPIQARQWLLLILVTVWGLRLGGYIWIRSIGKGEDSRYAAMRADHAESWAWRSLVTVFALQGALVAAIGLPHLMVQAQMVSPGWRWTDALGLGIWLIGFVFEAGADWQMLRFKRDPANKGRVMDRGFWAVSRHPNYFGDAMVWWGMWVIALGAPHGVWTLPSVVLMTFFLLKVSGVALLEKTIVERRPAYRDYIERTPAFFPWFPKKRAEGGS